MDGGLIARSYTGPVGLHGQIRTKLTVFEFVQEITLICQLQELQITHYQQSVYGYMYQL